MKLTRPDVVRRRITRERRRRRIVYLRRRRPDAPRLQFLEFADAVAIAWDGIASATQTAIAAMEALTIRQDIS